MKGIILTSHGRLAEGMLDTLTLFCGDVGQIEVVCLLPEEDIEHYLTELQLAIKRVDTGEGVIVFCDLLFGTPCNCSGKILNTCDDQSKINVVTGMNLAMVLEYVGSRTSDMKNDEIVKIGQQGITDFNELLLKRNN